MSSDALIPKNQSNPWASGPPPTGCVNATASA